MIRVHSVVRRRAVPGAFLYVTKYALMYLLAMSMVFAPLAPAFAFMAGSGQAHIAQAAHDGHHQFDGPARLSTTRSDQHSKSCAPHESCIGQCCGCCAQCLNAVFLAQPVYFHAQPVQTPVLSRLHSLILITSPDRPPRSFSL